MIDVPGQLGDQHVNLESEKPQPINKDITKELKDGDRLIGNQQHPS